MLNEIRKTVFQFQKRNPVLYLHHTKLEFNFSSFSSRKLHKNYQISGKINSHFCLMLSVYNSFHQRPNSRQRNHILQDLTGLEI